MSDKQQSMALLFECPICLLPLEDQRMLTCLHTLCHKCLNAHIQQSGKDGQFLCPICREALQIPAKGADDFSKNFFVKNCMELYAATKTQTRGSKEGEEEKQVPRESVCANSEKGDECAKPEQFCKDCCEYLCRNCSRIHRRSKLSRDHVLIPVDELTEEMVTEAMNKPEVPKCQKHKDEQLKLYCDTDQDAVCMMCCQTTHRSHDIREISDIDDDVKPELEKAIASLQSLTDEAKQQSANVSQLQQSLQSNSSSAIASCDGLFDKMRQMLNQEATQVKDKIRKVNDEGSAQADVQNKNLTLHLQLLDTLRSFVHDLLHKGSVFNRLASLPNLRSRLQHLQSPSQSSAQLAPGINVPSASALIVDSVGGLVLEEEVAFPDGTGGVKVTQKCRVMPDKSDVDVQTANAQIDRPVQAVCEQKDQSVQNVSSQKDHGLQAVCDQVHEEVQTIAVKCIPAPELRVLLYIMSVGPIPHVQAAAESVGLSHSIHYHFGVKGATLLPLTGEERVEIIVCRENEIRSVVDSYCLTGANTANRRLVLVHETSRFFSGRSLQKTLKLLGKNKRLFKRVVHWKDNDAVTQQLADYFIEVTHT